MSSSRPAEAPHGHFIPPPHQGDAGLRAPAPGIPCRPPDQLRLARRGVRRGLCSMRAVHWGIHLLVVVCRSTISMSQLRQHHCGPAYQLDGCLRQGTGWRSEMTDGTAAVSPQMSPGALASGKPTQGHPVFQAEEAPAGRGRGTGEVHPQRRLLPEIRRGGVYQEVLGYPRPANQSRRSAPAPVQRLR